MEGALARVQVRSQAVVGVLCGEGPDDTPADRVVEAYQAIMAATAEFCEHLRPIGAGVVVQFVGQGGGAAAGEGGDSGGADEFITQLRTREAEALKGLEVAAAGCAGVSVQLPSTTNRLLIGPDHQCPATVAEAKARQGTLRSGGHLVWVCTDLAAYVQLLGELGRAGSEAPGGDTGGAREWLSRCGALASLEGDAGGGGPGARQVVHHHVYYLSAAHMMAADAPRGPDAPGPGLSARELHGVLVSLHERAFGRGVSRVPSPDVSGAERRAVVVLLGVELPGALKGAFQKLGVEVVAVPVAAGGEAPAPPEQAVSGLNVVRLRRELASGGRVAVVGCASAELNQAVVARAGAGWRCWRPPDAVCACACGGCWAQ